MEAPKHGFLFDFVLFTSEKATLVNGSWSQQGWMSPLQMEGDPPNPPTPAPGVDVASSKGGDLVPAR